MTTTLRRLVYSALDIAVKENDYFELMTMPAIEVARDIVDYADEFAFNTPDDLVPHIEDYQKKVPL